MLGARGTLTAMVAAFLVSLLWVVSPRLVSSDRPGVYPWSIEPIYAGLGTSLLVYAGGWWLRHMRRGAELRFAAEPRQGEST